MFTLCLSANLAVQTHTHTVGASLFSFPVRGWLARFFPMPARMLNSTHTAAQANLLSERGVGLGGSGIR